jgi:hypothetical protein
MTAAQHIPYDDPSLTPEQRKTAAREVCWRAGDLSFLLHEGQELLRERFRANTSRRYLANIGRGWGKSFWALVEAVEVCLRIPDAQVRYAAPEAKMVETIVAPHMQAIRMTGPEDLRPVWKEQKGYWLFPNGSKLFVAGANAGGADRLRGVSTHFAVIDEARDIDCLGYLIKNVLTPRLTEQARLLIISTPPEMPDHPLTGYILEAQTRNAYMHAPTWDAPHITPERMAEFIADYTGPNDPAFRREFGAEIIADPERAVLPEFSEHESLIVDELVRPEHAMLHVIGDAGFDDLDVLAFGYYDFRADLDVIEAEVVLQRSRSDLLDAAVARMERDLWGREGRPPKVHRRRIDAQPKVRADMSREEWQADDPDDAVRHWGGVTKAKAANVGSFRASANAARVRMARGRVRVHPRCTTIIAHAKAARWATNGNQLERIKDDKGRTVHHFDGCAALIYFLRDLDRSTNPYPLLAPGVGPDTHHVPPELLAERKKIRQIFGRGTRR